MLSWPIGRWLVHRTIADFRGDSRLIFAGHAVVTDSTFEEHCQFEMGGKSFDSHRQYRLEMSEDGVSVRFPDGSHFVRLAHQACQVVSHVCGEDHYQGRFVVRDRDQWAEVWSVVGPRKRYRSITRYRRDTTRSTGDGVF